MFGMFSDEEQSVETNAYNEQVANQGNANVSRVIAGSNVGSTGTGNSVSLSIVSSDREVVLASIESAAKSSVAGALSALGSAEKAIDANTQVAVSGMALAGNVSKIGLELAGNVSNQGLALAQGSYDVATAAINASHQNVATTLGALLASQDRASELVEGAVASAQHIALNATPVSPGAYAESIAGQKQEITKLLIFGALAVGAIIVFRK